MKGHLVYLLHIRDALDRVLLYAAVGHERYMAEPQWQDGIIRQLEIVGEATERLPAEFRDLHPEIA